MNLFTWLLVGHLVGDFLLQNQWMALNKAERPLPLLAHSLVYTASVTLIALPAGGISIPAIAFIFTGHIILDSRRFTDLWLKYITGGEDVLWLKIVQDQCWHVVILALATLM